MSELQPLHGWGRFPRQLARVDRALSRSASAISIAGEGALIARGLGRSYGDSSLAGRVLDMTALDHFLSFDSESGLLKCEAGLSLATILRHFVPRGWFLPVTPGTRHVTIGGAIASDVHGKNHHGEGSFCDHIGEIELMLGNGEVLTLSRELHPELFHATCGGMGLTGLILSATLHLRPIGSSLIDETTLKMESLDQVLAAFEEHASTTYSVAWIDCLARGGNLGRSLLMLGEHLPEGELVAAPDSALPVPLEPPAMLLNHYTVAAFNQLYYHRIRGCRLRRTIPYAPFFYPLDSLSDWNRMYGRPGFVQYQFVVPEARSLRIILEQIANSGRGSFLAVLKAFGEGNNNLLSFPRSGYTLALDFKAEPEIFALLNRLDHLVLEHGGRLYLAKDARMSAVTFRASYPRWGEMVELRERYHASGRFLSSQAKRLGFSL